MEQVALSLQSSVRHRKPAFQEKLQKTTLFLPRMDAMVSTMHFLV